MHYLRLRASVDLSCVRHSTRPFRTPGIGERHNDSLHAFVIVSSSPAGEELPKQYHLPKALPAVKARKDIHIGHEIQRVLRERGMSVTTFASLIYCHRKNVYDIFTRKTIDIDKLILISEVLDYDFIRNLYLDSPSPEPLQLVLTITDGHVEITKSPGSQLQEK